jgi:hypothetical protein
VLADASRRSLMRGHIDRERSLKIPGKKPQLQRDFEFLAKNESPDPNGHKSTVSISMTIKNARAFYKSRRSLREGRRGGLMTLASARRPRIPAESLGESLARERARGARVSSRHA